MSDSSRINLLHHYPLALLLVGHLLFPFQAKGSILHGPNGKPVGSKLIAQEFTSPGYFQPRPSAASYDAAASSSSSYAASNPALRDRVARTLGHIVKMQNGQPVASDIESWFKENSDLVSKWAQANPALAKTWFNDPKNKALVEKSHPADEMQFFQQFAKQNPGKFPSDEPISAIFFDMWLKSHPEAQLKLVPGDFVTTSASGLDPHITLQNAHFQLDRVVQTWAKQV